MSTLNDLLAKSSARHSHLCPRQVLGVRMALAGAEAIGLDVPRADKRMLVIVETDGCFADGIEVTTGCTVGHRTLRVEDYGKIAATFIHVKDGRAVRLAPYPDARQRAYHYAPGQKRHYFAQLEGYQVMPAQELFMIQEVELTTPDRQRWDDLMPELCPSWILPPGSVPSAKTGRLALTTEKRTSTKMTATPNSLPLWELLFIIPAIAFLYASVGFGGASGYLAAMTFFAIAPAVMSSTALMLNLFVSSTAFFAYFRARHFASRLLWPFLLTSIPAARRKFPR